MSNPPKAIIIGISGCSSSGKTTLSRLLRDIFPNTFVLHEDDFYKPEEELPKRDGLLDWDSPDSLSIPDIAESLKHIRENGSIPVSSPSSNLSRRSSHGVVSSSELSLTSSPQPDLHSIEDQNTVGPCPIPSSLISSLKQRISIWISPGNPGNILLTQTSPRICIFDGFLLYSPAMLSIRLPIDIKFLLRASYQKAKERRENRSGYVTQEDFWKDPEGYVEKVVWPNYVKEHAWMFEDGDVEGKVKELVRGKLVGLECRDEVDEDLGTVLEWVVGVLMERLPGLVGK